MIPDTTAYALSFSGGKDSMLALDRAHRAGLHVATLFTIHDSAAGRVRFHGVRAASIAAQAAALGIPLVQAATHPEDYGTVFERTLDRLSTEGIGGIIFGNIHLADIRDWYEERVTARGLRHVEPLWGEAGPALAREVVARGYRVTVVSIDPARTPLHWLGRTLDDTLLADIAAHPEIDPAGERGEYHTFVHDGPTFRYPLRLTLGGHFTADGQHMMETEVRPHSTDNPLEEN